MVWRVASGAGSTTSGHTSGRQSSLTTLLFLPGSSQADQSTPSPIKLSLDRPELGSNPHRSPVLSCDVQERLFLKINNCLWTGTSWASWRRSTEGFSGRQGVEFVSG